MLVHVKRDELLAIAAQTAKAAPKTATSEAVLGIHVEADSRRSMLTLTATNYEIVIRASMGASVEQSGSVVISAALFPAAIASLPEQDVDLETEHPGQLTIRSGHARFRLSALSGDKYPMPELPFPDDTLPVSGLRSLARNTLFAVAEDGVPSPPMKCVRLHVGPDGLKASASNGFCIMEADGDKQCKGQIELLLPARSLKVLASLSNDSDVYEMGVTGKSLVFWSGTLLFSARLVEGKFPNMLNRITMTGRLVADPELRRTQSGVSVTSFRIANDRDYGKGEEKETDFFDVVAWRSTAEFICKYFTKGRMISVDGRLQTRGWKDREGNNRVSIEILVDNAYFADSKKDDAAGDFPADDQFAGYGAYQGSVPGGGDDFAPDF